MQNALLYSFFINTVTEDQMICYLGCSVLIRMTSLLVEPVVVRNVPNLRIQTNASISDEFKSD
jgi:hypothetical protein